MRRDVLYAMLLALLPCLLPGVQPAAAQTDTAALLHTLLSNESAATAHRGFYRYRSEERSDRTGQHLWVEQVVETPVGRVRLLEAEDGQPLTPERRDREAARLRDDAAHPDAFAKREAAGANDEAHAKQMLQLLPRAFLFDPPVDEGSTVRLRYRPNPDYQPQSLEERVLHSMVGSVVIDKGMTRLRALDGHLPADISFGFGLATLKAGSTFSTLREHVLNTDWKTEQTHTDIVGRALLLKNLGRKSDLRRSDYSPVGPGLSVAQAVDLLLH